MQRLTALFCLSLLPLVACDDADPSIDQERTAELSQALIEDGFFVNADGDIVKDDELDVSDDAPDGLTTRAQTMASAKWRIISTESCTDLFGRGCTSSFPSPQRTPGSSCTAGSGFAWKTKTSSSVYMLHCS